MLVLTISIHNFKNMSQTTLPTQPDEAQAPAHAQPTPASSPWSMPMIALVVRLITLVFLIVSTSLLASNSTTITAYDITVTVHFSDVYAYRYALASAVIGLSYTLFQLPSSIHQVTSGKRLFNHARFIISEFLGDKIVLSLLATGAGAAFGATVDLKKNFDDLDDALVQYDGITTFSPVRAKLDDFFSRAYFPAIFLLIAFLTCLISSVLSSLALTKNTG